MKALRVLLASGIVLALYVAAAALTPHAPPTRRGRCPRGYRCE